MRLAAAWSVSALLLAAAPPRARDCYAFAALDGNKGWEKLKLQLDRIPTFTVANSEGQPLQYEIDGSPYALFYADIEEAQVELEASRKQYPDLGCDLIPVGLGSAYQLNEDKQAKLIPGTAELKYAGAPQDVTAMGQALPLFACMEMSQETDAGPSLPLFLSWADCAAAVKQATQLDDPEEKLEIVGLSLPSVVERLGGMGSDQPMAFLFIPDSRAVSYIQEYLGP